MSRETRRRALLATGFVLSAAACSSVRPHRSAMMTFEDLRRLPTPPAGRRMSYGKNPLQFGELRLPPGRGPYPVAIVIHGGCWSSEYNLDHIANFADALTRAGIATWSVEYRRVGDAGWPATFEDMASGADYLRTLAPTYALDPSLAVAVGHSAGGHLALWLAARPRLPKASPLYSPNPLHLRGVVSLAGIPDLRRAFAEKVCDDAVGQLLGGAPTVVPERYRAASPLELLPLGVPQRLVHGAEDSIVPLAFSGDYAIAARNSGDDARLIVVPRAGHFELIAPASPAWPMVVAAVGEMLERRPAP